MKVAKLYDDAKLPNRKHNTDAGLDLYSITSVGVLPNGCCVINTGITIEIPKGCFGLIMPKSRSNFLVGGGVIDQEYQGELLVKVFNPTKECLIINCYDAIGQLIIVPILVPEIEEVSRDEIHQVETERGNSGGILKQATFSSTIEPEE